MLVLMRRPQESIILTLEDGRTITITLLGIDRATRSRIGITADKTIMVNRSEVQRRVDAEGTLREPG